VSQPKDGDAGFHICETTLKGDDVMSKSRLIEVRRVTHETDWASDVCIVCRDLHYLNPSTWLTPATTYSEAYVDGEGTGFLVCDDCLTMPSEELDKKVRAFFDETDVQTPGEFELTAGNP
jgi:hypothetical protein